MKVLGSVLVLGRITATYMAADFAKPQMYPGVAYFEAILAAPNFGF
jgi:hypothetical protein